MGELPRKYIWTLVLLESRESRVSHMDANSKQRSGHQIQGFTPGVLSPVEPSPTKKPWALFANVQAIFIFLFFIFYFF